MMSYRAWAYVSGILVAGTVVSGLALLESAPASQQGTFVALIVLATCAQLFKAEAPNHRLYYTTTVFFFAGLLLLHPSLFVPLVIIPLVVEWIRERLVDSPHLRAWYLQPFNIATHIIVGFTARWVYLSLVTASDARHASLTMVAAMAAALTYVVLNHLIVGLAIDLARGVAQRDSHILEIDSLLPDFTLVALGYIAAVVWTINPWLILPALSPLVLISRALSIPQLKKEAQMDAKTGLLNARYFARLFTAEAERAARFERPLALIMADLDLLRNINNTYGHLAGDAVLAGIGEIIRREIREYDIAGRFGGEEFAIVLPEAGPGEARAIAERLRQAVEAVGFAIPTSPTPIHATMSLGVANFPSDARTPTELIHEADLAVYRAKLQGRNCVVCASEVPSSFKLENSPVEDRLAALYDGEVVPKTARSHDVSSSSDAARIQIEDGSRAGTATTVRDSHPVRNSLFTGAVIATGAIVAVVGFILSPHPDLIAIGLLTLLAAITQLDPLSVPKEDSITTSVSVALTVAAAVLTGIPGLAIVGGGRAVSNWLVSGQRFHRHPPLGKPAFTWSVGVLGGLAPVFAVSIPSISLHVTNMPLLVVLVLVAALVYFGVEGSLTAASARLSDETRATCTSAISGRRLVGQYLVPCLSGLFLAVAYTTLGGLGLFGLAVPLVLIGFVYNQYLERTETGIRKFRRVS